MIYAKIFIDVVGDNTYIVVETPNKNIDEKYCLLAGDHINKYGDTYNIVHTRILSASTIAISKEAKDKFLEMTSFGYENKVSGIFNCDFAFYKLEGKNVGVFSFKPDKDTPHKRIFNIKNKVIFDFNQLEDVVFDYMQVYDNEILKNLDITKPIDSL